MGVSKVIVERGVRVPMSDGVELAADVWRPDGSEPVPVLLQRTPYDRSGVPVAHLNWIVLVEAGYAVVVMDCRGRFDSGGTFTPFVDEARDGAESIAWAAARPWSNGLVGLIGGSYHGATQWLAAGERPPALRAMVPYVTSSDYYEGWVYQGGAFQLGFLLRWSLASLVLPSLLARRASGEPLDAEVAAVRDAVDHVGRLFRIRPLRGIEILDRYAPWYDEWLRHPSRDTFWEAISPQERHAETEVPALNIGGWYDLFNDGTLRNFTGMRTHGATAAARDGQRLIVGPWSHSIDTGVFPERDFGSTASRAVQDPTTLHRQFFDRWLKDIRPPLGTGPAAANPDTWNGRNPVRLFVLGANRWSDEETWPPADVATRPWYLHGDGRANSAGGDGRLSPEPPTGREPEDAFRYDPDDPVPTVGGATLMPGGTPGWNSGPWDQRGVENRQDVLVYTSAPVERPLEVIGSVEAVLFISSNAVDTDITAKLVDVHPDERAEILADGILRVRYRESLSEPRRLEPGRIVEVRVLVGATAVRFAAGHRIRLDLSSSNFPRFDANTNTGGTIADEGPESVLPAVNRVFHDASHPSRVLLPIRAHA